MMPVIVDAENLLRRGIMASVRADARAKSYTGGMYSAFTTMSNLLRIDLRIAGPILMCFDHRGRGIKYGSGIHPERLKLLPGYKESRGEKPTIVESHEMDEAMEQVDIAFDMFQNLGVPCVRYKNREADDIIGAAVKLWLKRGHRPVVVSGDHDMLQCVAWGADVWMLNRKVLVTQDNFEDEIGIPPELFLLYKALIGDKSDEIEGVKGVGEKTAKQLVMAWADQLSDEELEDCMDVPTLQMVLFCGWAKNQEKPKVLTTVDAQRKRLSKVIKGIDISWSFDDITTLAGAIDNPPTENLKLFAARARKYGMTGLVNKAQTHYHPVLHAARKAGDRKKSASHGKKC